MVGWLFTGRLELAISDCLARLHCVAHTQILSSVSDKPPIRVGSNTH